MADLSEAKETEGNQGDSAEGTGQNDDDLNEVLNEYRGSDDSDADTTADAKSKSKSETDDDPDVRQTIRDIQADIKAREMTETQNDIAKAVKVVVGETGAPEGLARGYLNDRASGDERVLKAFQQRRRNPQGWERVQQGLAREFQGMIAAFGSNRDKDAVASAVKASTSTKATEAGDDIPDNVEELSDAAFESLVHRMGKRARG